MKIVHHLIQICKSQAKLTSIPKDFLLRPNIFAKAKVNIISLAAAEEAANKLISMFLSLLNHILANQHLLHMRTEF